MPSWLRNEAQAYAAPIAVVSVISALGTVAAPALAGNPLLLVALAPRLPFRPVGRHVALAGAGGASPVTVAIADLAGTVAYVIGVVWIGDTIW